MFIQSRVSRVLGVLAIVAASVHCSSLLAAGKSTPAGQGEVSVEYKTDDPANFQLAEYEEELLECSALSAIHMWVGDNIGDDSGSEVRRALAEDYWLEVSRSYLSLAEKASGGADLTSEVGAEIKAVTAEWRRLTESDAGPEAWAEWYSLVDRCETWRPEQVSRSYYTRGRELAANSKSAPVLAAGSD